MYPCGPTHAMTEEEFDRVLCAEREGAVLPRRGPGAADGAAWHRGDRQSLDHGGRVRGAGHEPLWLKQGRPQPADQNLGGGIWPERGPCQCRKPWTGRARKARTPWGRGSSNWPPRRQRAVQRPRTRLRRPLSFWRRSGPVSFTAPHSPSTAGARPCKDGGRRHRHGTCFDTGEARDAWLPIMRAVGLGMTVGGAGFASVSSREMATSPLRPLPRGCVTGTAPSHPRDDRVWTDPSP
jgi:hypothetical protein